MHVTCRIYINLFAVRFLASLLLCKGKGSVFPPWKGIEGWIMKKTALALLVLGIVLTGASGSDSAFLTKAPAMDSPEAVTDSAARVPEPATMFLFGTGLIGLSVLIRRK